jgi:hypothetical protein
MNRRSQINPILFFLLFPLLIFAQSPTDSAAASVPQPSGDVLPQIQLEDYTIIGLAKITLPQKKRTQVFRDVDIVWTSNDEILQKELPKITFQFSRIKPRCFACTIFPGWIRNCITDRIMKPELE